LIKAGLKPKYLVIILTLSLSQILFCQVDNIPAENPVYDFLRELEVRGIISGYTDAVLPYSREFIVDKLTGAEQNSDLNEVEKNYLTRLLSKLNIKDDSHSNIFDDFPSDLFVDSLIHLYSYIDSTIHFRVDPVAEIKLLYSDLYKDKSLLISYGGKFIGSYNGWLGFYLKATNGSQFYNRNVAENDKRVSESFTFNNSELSYFDDTEGYIRLRKGIVGFELGRERILWGNGYIDQMMLSENPPKFDLVKLDISYKTLSYNFIHGWLVNPLYAKDKSAGKISKYIALNRLGFSPGNKISLGATQAIIYGNRPPEIAYMNPFLFWESAQRSLGDFDNSFLSFDLRYLITSGVETRGTITFDDINPKFWNTREWTNKENRIAWQVCSMITYPYFFLNSYLQIEYTQLRPYIFSHYGSPENLLSYTNNGYTLGPDLQPNSTRLSVKLHYRCNSKLNCGIMYQHTLHGNNIYDVDGSLLKNYGGDVFHPFTSSDGRFVPLLSGNRESENLLSVMLDYEFIPEFLLNLRYQNFSSREPDKKQSYNLFSLSVNFNLN
jgi:hypothetical protein